MIDSYKYDVYFAVADVKNQSAVPVRVRLKGYRYDLSGTLMGDVDVCSAFVCGGWS